MNELELRAFDADVEDPMIKMRPNSKTRFPILDRREAKGSFRVSVEVEDMLVVVEKDMVVMMMSRVENNSVRAGYRAIDRWLLFVACQSIL